MLIMVVTLDVSHLEISALKLFKLSNSLFMLKMDEVSQLAMAPYVVKAEDAFKSNAWIAFFREAVLVKVPGGCEGGEGGSGGEGGEGGHDGGAGGGGGGKQSSHPAKFSLPSVIHWIGVPSGTTPSGESVPQKRTPFIVR